MPPSKPAARLTTGSSSSIASIRLPSPQQLLRAKTEEQRASLLGGVNKALKDPTAQALTTRALLDSRELMLEVISNWKSLVDSMSACSQVLRGLFLDKDSARLVYAQHAGDLMPELLRRMQLSITEAEDKIMLWALNAVWLLASVPTIAVRIMDDYPAVYTTAFSLLRTDPEQVKLDFYGESAIDSAMVVLSTLLRTPALEQRLSGELVEVISVLITQLDRPQINGFLQADTARTLSNLIDGNASSEGLLARHPLFVPRLVTIMEEGDKRVKKWTKKPLGEQEYEDAIESWKVQNDCMCIISELSATWPDNQARIVDDNIALKYIINALPAMMGVVSRVAIDNGLDGNERFVHFALRNAMSVFFHLAMDRALAQKLLQQGRNSVLLLPMLATMLNQLPRHHVRRAIHPDASKDPIEYAPHIIYYLSCPVSNQPVMRECTFLLEAMAGDRQARYTADSVLFTMLAQINLSRPVDGKPGKVADAQTISAVYELLSSSAGRSDEVFFPISLLAMRYLAAVQENRIAFWVQFGSSSSSSSSKKDTSRSGALIPLLLKALRFVIDRGNRPHAVEDGMSALLQFAADRPPCEALRKQLPTVTALVESAAKLSRAAGTAGNLLLMRLNAAASPADEAPTAGALDCLRAGRWDDLVVPRAEEKELLAKLLDEAIKMVAPQRVVERLLAAKYPTGNGNNDKKSALHVALEHEDVDAALFLLSLEDVRNQAKSSPPLLMLSCKSAKLLPVTRRLLELSTSSSSLDFAIATPPHTALGMCIHQSDSQGYEQAKFLLQAGASARAAQRCIAPLLEALMREHVPTIRLLLEHGADVLHCDMHAAMVLASRSRTPSNRMSEELLSVYLDMFVAQDAAAAAVVSGGGGDCPSVVTSAALFAQFYPMLLPSQAAPPPGQRPTLLRWIELGADVTQALQAAVELGGVDDVALLLQVGADPNYNVNGGDVGDGDDGWAVTKRTSPLRAALAHGKADVARMLIKAGAVHEDDGDECASMDVGGDDGFNFTFTFCAHCRRRPIELQPCSGCVMVAYCDETCQVEHWRKAHKVVCKKKREMDATRGGGCN